MPRPLNSRLLAKHKKRFLRFFPKAFKDEQYISWERTYKWEAHKLWLKLLAHDEYKNLLRAREFAEIANRALQVESKTNFLFSFEKMALRDALKTGDGAKNFAEGLYALLHGPGSMESKFIAWIITVSQLPRKNSRVLSWPILTFFPFIAQPTKHIILKPTGMRNAAAELGFDLEYSSRPSWTTYKRLLELADLVRDAISDLHPKDYHDLQAFLWTVGSPEYQRLEEEMA